MIGQISRDEVRSAIEDKLCAYFATTSAAATDEQVFRATAMVIREIMSRFLAVEDPRHAEKEVHYMSMEFLMGRSLMKNAFNLGISDAVIGALEDMGRSAVDIFEEEPDAGLGNGGLGRLAACYMDSMATLGMAATGYSLCYELGIFKQKLAGGKQTEQAAENAPEVFVPIQRSDHVRPAAAPFTVRREDDGFVQQRFTAPPKLTIDYDEDDRDEDTERAETAGSGSAVDEGAKPFRFISSSSFEERPQAPETPVVTSEPERPPLKVIGEAFGTYILCTSGEEFIMMDKHAAHERIRFEKRKKELIKSSQLLAETIEVTLNPAQYAAVAENTDLLADIGIDVILEDGRCGITAAPSAFTGGADAVDPAEMIIHCADALAEGNENIEAVIYGDLLHTRACKSAIKAHDVTSRQELEALAQEVWANEGIRFCPHGRPIMVKLTEYEIEKYFSRIQ